MPRGGTADLLPALTYVPSSPVRVASVRAGTITCLRLGAGAAEEIHFYRSPFAEELLLFQRRASSTSCGARLAIDLGYCSTCASHDCWHLGLAAQALARSSDVLEPAHWVRSRHPLGISYRGRDAELLHLKLAAAQGALIEIAPCIGEDVCYPLRRSGCCVPHAHATFAAPEGPTLWERLAAMRVYGIQLGESLRVITETVALESSDGAHIDVRVALVPGRDPYITPSVLHDGHLVADAAVRATCCGVRQRCPHWVMLDALVPRLARTARDMMELTQRVAAPVLAPAAA